MAGRPDDGYHVRSRITARSDGRTRLLTGVLIAAAGLWLVASLTADRRPPTTADASPGTTPGATAAVPTAPPTPIPTPPPTPKPVLEIFEGAPIEPIAMLAPGLAWFAPVSGSSWAGAPADWAQWPFLLADGSSVCLCLEPVLQTGGSIAHVLRFDPDGQLLRDVVVEDWPAASIPLAIADVGIAPDAASLFVATAYRDGEEPKVRLDRVALDGSIIAGRLLGTIESPDQAELQAETIRVWVAPDGKHVRVVAGTAHQRPEPEPGPLLEKEWLVPVRPASIGEPVVLSSGAGEDPLLVCVAAGWATATDFVRVCTSASGDVGQLFVHRESVDGDLDSVVLKLEEVGLTSSWLIDQAHGVIYGWEATRQSLYRVEIPGMAVLSRHVPLPDAGRLLDPEVGMPAAAADRARWDTAFGGIGISGSLVGSPDGTIIYALGPAVIRAGAPPSEETATGIYAFEASSLRLIAHWAPEVRDQSIGLTTDGRFLLSVAIAPLEEVRIFGDAGPMLVVRDVADGRIVEIARRIAIAMQSTPRFLVPVPS